MAILWCRDRGKSGGFAEQGAAHFTSQYKLKSDSPVETRVAVLNCGLLPVYSSINPENPLAVCAKVDATRDAENPFLWDATAEWNTNTSSGNDPADDQLQPDLRRPKWSAKFIPFPMARFVDLGGKPLCDKAETPFDPAPDIPIHVDEIVVTRFQSTVDRPAQRKFMGAANLDKWLGAEIGEALIDDISVGPEEFIQGVYWFPTTYRILVKPRIVIVLPKKTKQNVGGWNPEYVLNAGPLRKVKDPVTNELSVEPILHDGFYDGRPAFLALDGTQIPIDKATGQLTADPIFLEFRTKITAHFSWLGLTPPPGWTGV